VLDAGSSKPRILINYGLLLNLDGVHSQTALAKNSCLALVADKILRRLYAPDSMIFEAPIGLPRTARLAQCDSMIEITM
jgi:hypothetical protein